MLGETETNDKLIELQNTLALKIAQDPYDPENLKSVLSIYSQLGMYEDALDVSLTLLKLDPENPENLINFDLANLELLKSIVKDSDENYILFRQIADLHFKLGQWEDSITWYRKCNTCPESDHSYSFNLAEAYYNIKNYSDALICYNLYSSKHTDTNVMLKISECSLKSGKYYDAALNATEVLLQDPQNIKAIEFLATSFFELKEYAKAVNILHLGFSIEPENTALINIYAQTCINLGQYDKALWALGKYLESNPSNISDIYLERGIIFLKQNNLLEAIVEFNKATSNAKPSDSVIFQSIAHQLMTYNHRQSAKSFAEKGLKIEPENIEITAILSKISLELGDFDIAESLAQNVLSLDNKSEEALYTLSLTHIQKENFEDSKNLLKHLISINPKKPEYYLHFLYCAYKTQDENLLQLAEYTKSIFRINIEYTEERDPNTALEEYLQKIITTLTSTTIYDKINAYITLNNVRELITDNKLQEAFILWHKVISVIPTDKDTLIEGIKLSIKLNNYPYAEYLTTMAKDILKINYSDELREQISFLYCKTGRYDLAEFASEQILETPKDQASWYANLGNIYLHLGAANLELYDIASDQYNDAVEYSSRQSALYSNLIELLSIWQNLKFSISEEYKQEMSNVFQERIKSYQQIGAESLANTATAYNALKSYDQAIEFANAALVFNDKNAKFLALVNLFTSYKKKGHIFNDYESLNEAHKVCNILLKTINPQNPLHAHFISERQKILLEFNTIENESTASGRESSSGCELSTTNDELNSTDTSPSPDSFTMTMGDSPKQDADHT